MLVSLSLPGWAAQGEVGAEGHGMQGGTGAGGSGGDSGLFQLNLGWNGAESGSYIMSPGQGGTLNDEQRHKIRDVQNGADWTHSAGGGVASEAFGGSGGGGAGSYRAAYSLDFVNEVGGGGGGGGTALFLLPGLLATDAAYRGGDGGNGAVGGQVCARLLGLCLPGGVGGVGGGGGGAGGNGIVSHADIVRSRDSWIEGGNGGMGGSILSQENGMSLVAGSGGDGGYGISLRAPLRLGNEGFIGGEREVTRDLSKVRQGPRSQHAAAKAAAA
ncbi:hypothetical protein WJ968_24675 [Achromobacter xylosoxidans]